MPVPDFQSFFVPVLRIVADRKDHSMSELRERVAADLALTPDDLNQKLPSGVQTVFANRVAWSAVYLNKAGALERIKRGVFRITDRGKDLLALNVPRLTIRDLSKYPEFVAFHRGTVPDGTEQAVAPEKVDSASETPEEQLANAYTLLRDALANDLLESVKKASPAFFEELVHRSPRCHGIWWLDRGCREGRWEVRRRRHRWDYQGRQTRP
jgi:restriction system protein